MKLNLSLGFCSSNTEEDFARLEIGDNLSGVPMVRVNLSKAQLFDLLASRYLSEVDGEVGALELVGKKCESRTVWVDVMEDGSRVYDGDKLRALIKERTKGLQDDGWEIDGYCLRTAPNLHKFKGGEYQVVMRQWFDIRGEEDE
jgi:hypothetical protein